ncbi:heavy metal-associated domain-containing protein [Clostridium sp. KNHs216]|uniref:heavy-metal-associated domain-containing protein n=1 Tax=Clostridium sp. KNHs216 TaxID=1550235 RepID=UPI0011504E00|nr:heavy metal-associated domain-containing protein [Clostridium sp. KNHs216]TQI66490.1 Cu2+-exporting ATPase [Clostridium sp. KNHs216]
MNTMLCSVSGIQNKECKTQIKNALDKIRGVQEVGVNLTTGSVKVEYNEPATEEEIKDCIEHTGFKIEYE